MGEQAQTSDSKVAFDDQRMRAALIALARARIARQDEKFSIKALCDEAGVSRAVFQRCFAGKQALLAAVMQPEPVAADPWLERRLRVFERALTALEAKAEITARDHSIAIAQLKEILAQAPASIAEPVAAPVAVPMPVAEPASEDAEEKSRDEEDAPVEPPVSKDEMAAFLDSARRAAREAEERRVAAPRKRSPVRSLMVAGLALLTTLAICAVMTLGHAARAPEGEGIAHRHLARDLRTQMQARADSGDRAAQAALALSYLRERNPDNAAALRWASAAARHGDAAAQYVLGSLYAGGQGVTADPGQAFFWFGAAARQGHVRAMHNLAIAYAEGLGTAKDPAQAAAWFARAAASGYRDSAFDLGVLYERGEGVPQDLQAALHWYQVAANAGDGPSAERVAVLREQLNP